jgi:hypothetical protein
MNEMSSVPANESCFAYEFAGPPTSARTLMTPYLQESQIGVPITLAQLAEHAIS